MEASRDAWVSPQEYLAMERQAEVKSEYLNGEVFALAGASLAHVRIESNTITALSNRLKGGPCQALGSNARVKVSQTGLYTYPDAVVVCGRPRVDDSQKDTLLNPTLVIEILSPSTQDHDRGAKFVHYRTLESLTDYVLIWQDAAKIEHFARQAADRWLLTLHQGLEAVLALPSIGCELPLADVFDGIDLPLAETITLRIMRERQAHYEGESYARRPPAPSNDR